MHLWSKISPRLRVSRETGNTKLIPSGLINHENWNRECSLRAAQNLVNKLSDKWFQLHVHCLYKRFQMLREYFIIKLLTITSKLLSMPIRLDHVNERLSISHFNILTQTFSKNGIR